MDGKKVKLRLEHISQSYIVKNEVSDAVVDVSLDVYDNEFLVILGPGRCGKTVLLNMIAGLEKPVDGSLFLDGEEIHGSDERIGMVFQKLALMPWKTVMENVEFGLKMKGVPKAQRRETAQKYINLVGLQGFEKSYPSQLSGGMKQRAGIARAYTNNPEIMLMDEPFGQLDAQTRYSMQDEVLRIWESEKRTFIFVTNEIGMGGTSENLIQRKFTDMQGWMNQYIATRANQVLLMVSGIPVKVKDEKQTID